MNKKVVMTLAVLLFIYLLLSALRYMHTQDKQAVSPVPDVNQSQFLIRKNTFDYSSLQGYEVWGLEKPAPKTETEAKGKQKLEKAEEAVSVNYKDFQYTLCIGKRCYPLYAIAKDYLIFDNINKNGELFLKLKVSDKIEDRVEVQKIDIRNSEISLRDTKNDKVEKIKFFKSDESKYLFEEKEKDKK